MTRRLPALALAALALTAAPAAAADSAFDSAVAESKAAMMGDPQTALKHALTALALARKEAAGSAQAEQLATAEWLQGEALLRLNRMAEAEPVIRAGVADAARAPNLKLRGQLAMAAADFQAVQGSVQAALSGYQEAYRILGQAHDPRGQAMALQNIGSIYQDARDYAKVLQYYAQSADAYPGDEVLLITARNNIGRAYEAQGKYAEATQEYEKALAIAVAMKSPLLQARILTNLASAEVAQGRLDAARRHLAAALPLCRDPAVAEWRPYVWGVMAQAALKGGEPATAVALLERTFQGQDLTKTSMLYRDFHEAAWRAYAAVGDDKHALAHLTAFKRLDDEARDVAATTNAALMAAQFDFANQTSRIATLKAGELKRDVALARSRSTVTAVLLACSLIVAVLLAAAFFWIRRSRNQVRIANAELSAANTALESAVQARTEFLATTSHEIRTPLNGILGMTQVLLADRALDPDVKSKVALVHGAGEAMRALVDDILDLSKIETGKLTILPAEMNLATLAEDVVRFWAERASPTGVAVLLDTEGAPRRIVEDEARLRQILFNLLSNAVKFTAKGEVRLKVRVDASADGEQLVLAVSDTGIGIPSDRFEDVFESFRQVDGSVTRTYGGSGLGLAICRRLANAMGGDVELESVLGEGSTFTVRLPLTRAEGGGEAAARVPTPEAHELADCRVLLADSNPLSQSLLKAVLAPTVRTVETVAAYDVAAREADRFDLLVIDAGLLGATADARAKAVRALAAAGSPVHVVVMIAKASDKEVARLLAAGACQVVRKPFAAPALPEALREGLAARNAEATAAKPLSKLG